MSYLFASGNCAGKKFVEARDGGGIFRDAVRFRPPETPLCCVGDEPAGLEPTTMRLLAVCGAAWMRNCATVPQSARGENQP
jgi:hypothetical protein